jgi:tRNA-splicing ligase RtcB
VGYDINCGVRLLRTNLTEEQVRPRLAELLNQIFRDVPSGVGEHGGMPLQEADLDGVLSKGAGWVVAKGYGRPEDLEATEERGCLAGADPRALSDRARKRGRPQLATLGSGNHFLELQVVERVYDEAAAARMGLDEPGQVAVMIHCGSRGLGHQVCDDAIEVMRRAMREYGIEVPDPQLSCVPVGSPEGRQYFGAMAAAANYAWANRQAIMHQVREAFQRVLKLGEAKLGMDLVWDVAHNIAKFEEHLVGGRSRRLCVHRKGATRAFPAGHHDIPDRYRDVGQPVIIPGDMGRASWVLRGGPRSMERSFGTTCHGAGRCLSRTAATKASKGRDIARELEQAGVIARSRSRDGLAEEQPAAYKDVDLVVEVVHRAGLSSKVARLRPLGVIKG